MLNDVTRNQTFGIDTKCFREESHAYDRLITRKEAAKYIGFKTNTLAVWACNGRYDLKPVKIGRSVRYRKSVLDKFLEEGMKPD